MKRKVDLSKLKIDYGGKKYEIDLYGHEDYENKKGLWVLAGRCADGIIAGLDDDGYFPCDTEEMSIARETVQSHVYRFVKFYILRPLNRQLANPSQNKNQM